MNASDEAPREHEGLTQVTQTVTKVKVVRVCLYTPLAPSLFCLSTVGNEHVTRTHPSHRCASGRLKVERRQLSTCQVLSQRSLFLPIVHICFIPPRKSRHVSSSYFNVRYKYISNRNCTFLKSKYKVWQVSPYKLYKRFILWNKLVFTLHRVNFSPYEQ